MDEGYRKDGEWALNIKSVVIFGKIRKIDDTQEAITILRKLGLKYYPTEESVEKAILQSAKRVQMMELTMEHMTGKLVNES